MKKYGLWVMVVLLFSLVLSACGSSNNSKNDAAPSATTSNSTQAGDSSGSSQAGTSDSGNKSGDSKKRIAVIVGSTQHEYWATVGLGAKQAGTELGVEVSFKGPSVETDIANQVAIVEDAITQKMDAIVVAPGDAKALVPAVEKAKAAGIPVITIDSVVDSEIPVSHIAVNSEKAAALAADHLAELIGKKGKVAMVNFSSGNSAGLARETGFKNQIKNYPEIELINTFYSGGDKAKALSITQDLLTSHPDLAGIFATNESNAVGVSMGVQDKGAQDKVVVVGFDSSQDEANMIMSGVLKATVVQNPFQEGYLGVKTALEVLEGKQPEKNIEIPPTLVNLDNINEPEIQKLIYPLGK